MKVYSIIDDAIKVKVTSDRMEMLEALYKLFKKYENKQSWFDVWEDEI